MTDGSFRGRDGVLILFFAAGVWPIAQARAITPEAILSQVRAEQQRYATFQAEIENQCHPYQNGQVRTSPLEVNSLLWRKTADRSFMRIQRAAGDAAAGIPAGAERWFSISPEYSRELDISTNGFPSAVVIRGEGMKEQLPTSLEKAIWEPFGPGLLTQVGNQNAQVVETDTGVFVLTASLNDGSLLMTMRIDPSVGFLPTSTEFHAPDGKLVHRTELSDLRKVDGLWIPFAYVQDQPPHSRMEYMVHWVRLNEQIPGEMLDFAFPENTRVDDRVANVVYRVSNARAQPVDPSMVAVTGSIQPKDPVASQPADESLLATAAEAAKRQGATMGDAASPIMDFYLPIAISLAAIILILYGWRRSSRATRQT